VVTGKKQQKNLKEVKNLTAHIFSFGKISQDL
jgi:hypothetical protein